jgi:hypothetical protein
VSIVRSELGNEIEEIELLWNAPPMLGSRPMDVTPSGIITEPTQAFPAVTTPEVIVKFGVSADGSPVEQRYVPSAGTETAYAGEGANPETVTATAVTTVANRRIEFPFRQCLMTSNALKDDLCLFDLITLQPS